MQVLENMLPMVGEINRAVPGAALLQLAGEYGVSIKIPEVLQPKMKRLHCVGEESACV